MLTRSGSTEAHRASLVRTPIRERVAWQSQGAGHVGASARPPVTLLFVAGVVFVFTEAGRRVLGLGKTNSNHHSQWHLGSSCCVPGTGPRVREPAPQSSQTPV